MTAGGGLDNDGTIFEIAKTKNGYAWKNTFDEAAARAMFPQNFAVG